MKQPRPVGLVRRLRREQTDAERTIWLKLRNRWAGGVKFRRQHPVDKYVVDFICIEAGLIVEIDGGQHNVAVNADRDKERTEFLESKGYKVIRFWNNDIFENLDGVLEVIYQEVMKRRHPHLNPLPQRERRGEEK